jgi:hypothetical protein
MLTRTSKRVKEVVELVRICLGQRRGQTGKVPVRFETTIYDDRLSVTSSHSTCLSYLNLPVNVIRAGGGGVESLGGVFPQCPTLTHQRVVCHPQEIRLSSLGGTVINLPFFLFMRRSKPRSKENTYRLVCV